jgi:hypothetical protein
MAGRLAKIALLGWVGTLLLVPVAGYALGFRGSNIENRTLAKGPGWSLHTLTHSSAWHRAADAFSDHMPLRDRAIRWRAEAEFNVFQDSPRPDSVIVGRDHWLFLQDEFQTCKLYPAVTPLQVAQAFQLARAAATSSGRELYTMLVPAKTTIEAEHYRSSQYSFEACPRAREQELERLFRGQPGVIDLWNPMRAAKREGGDLWIPNDSHTDTSGSIVIARALVEAIRPSAWQEGLEQSGPTYPYVGDLDVLAGITNTAKRHRLVVHGTPRAPIRIPLLALGDSQLDDSSPELDPYLPARHDFGLDQLLFGGIPRETIQAAHVILVESVQRGTYQRVTSFFYPLPLIDAFLPDIHRLPAAYALPGSTARSTLTLAPGVRNVPVRAKDDDVGAWRLLVFSVLTADQPLNVALLDAAGHPRSSPDSARGALPVKSVIALAVPPGVALGDVRLSIDAPTGATLSPLQVAPLSRR